MENKEMNESDRFIYECWLYQQRVDAWMQKTFGPVISKDKPERNHRFLEECLELVQSLGCTKMEALQLLDYVYDRPDGQPSQEVGGVMITLSALCMANDIRMGWCGETELKRIWGKVEQIRQKQASKPKNSPLPAENFKMPKVNLKISLLEQNYKEEGYVRCHDVLLENIPERALHPCHNCGANTRIIVMQKRIGDIIYGIVIKHCDKCGREIQI